MTVIYFIAVYALRLSCFIVTYYGNWSNNLKRKHTFFKDITIFCKAYSEEELRTPEREVQGSNPTTAVKCPWARRFKVVKVLVISRKRWLRQKMTEKLLTGRLNKKREKKKSLFVTSPSSLQVRRHYCPT